MEFTGNGFSTKQNKICFKHSFASRHDSESMPLTIFLGEPRNAFLIADQRTGKFERRGNQKPICREHDLIKKIEAKVNVA